MTPQPQHSDDLFLITRDELDRCCAQMSAAGYKVSANYVEALVLSRPHQPAAPTIQIEGIDGEMIDLLADDKELYLDSFAKFANNPAVDMMIQMFRDKQSLRTGGDE